MQFFAVAGEPITSGSITPSEATVSTPLFPAEKVMTMSFRSQENSSRLSESVVYWPAASEPHELEWTRAPSS